MAIWIHMQLTFLCRPDFQAGLQDFKNRLANYEKVCVYHTMFF